MTANQVASNATDAARLSELAQSAEEQAKALALAAYRLRLACDRGDGAGIFSALRKLETARTCADLSARSVTNHAVSDHGYF